MYESIKTRVKWVAALALSVEKIQPYKSHVCDVIEDIASALNSLDPQEATFAAIKQTINERVRTINNNNIRHSVSFVVDTAFKEAFSHAWENYQGFLENEARSAIVIARAVADGLQEACEYQVTTYEVPGD